MSKKALVTGAAGFIGHNLCKRLKKQGWTVVGVDRKTPEFETSVCDMFLIDDARHLNLEDLNLDSFSRIYQLAAEMGGAGYVFTGDNDADILSHSSEININLLEQLKGFKGKVFYSSSVCAYPDEVEGKESDAYPANPPSNYGWEKLFSERLYLACAKNYGLDVKIARFHNTFGPYGAYKGGREKAPAALCRKIIESDGEIEIWGDGEQLRPFIYIEDLLDGIEALMQSSITGPVNLGPSEGITINQLIERIGKISGKDFTIKYIPGPTGGQTRHANNDMAQKELGWQPKRNLDESLKETYEWIKEQIG